MIFLFRAVAAVLAFAAASVYGFLITLLRRDRSLVPYDYARMISRLMSSPLGIQVEVTGEHILSEAQPCVYVVNHQSLVDAPILGRIYPSRTVLVGKKELRWLPFFGWVYTATGNILIDRRNNPKAVQRMREAENAIRERGVSVFMFPEGTRGDVPGELLPFKKGAFHLAIAAGVPIVPIVVSPLKPLIDAKRFRITPGTIRVTVLEPIPTTGLEDANATDLLVRVRDRMTEVLRVLPTTARHAVPKS